MIPKPSFTHPIIPLSLTQGWGTLDPADYSQFGFTRHNGLDMILSPDKHILSPVNGTVVRVATKENGLWQPNGGGVFVGIVSEEMNFPAFSNMTPDGILVNFPAGAYRVLVDLLHLESISVKEGDIVTAGQLVAIGDNTGFTTGPHCHSQWRRVNWTSGVNYTLVDKNDANDSFDPTQFFVGGDPVVVFTRDLTIGSTGADVIALQRYLNEKGYQVAATGPGSKGQETNYFGTLTRDAVSKLQKVNGISPTAGYFGQITRQFVNNHQ